MFYVKIRILDFSFYAGIDYIKGSRIKGQWGTGPLEFKQGALPPYFKPCNLILKLGTCWRDKTYQLAYKNAIEHHRNYYYKAVAGLGD